MPRPPAEAPVRPGAQRRAASHRPRAPARRACFDRGGCRAWSRRRCIPPRPRCSSRASRSPGLPAAWGRCQRLRRRQSARQAVRGAVRDAVRRPHRADVRRRPAPAHALGSRARVLLLVLLVLLATVRWRGRALARPFGVVTMALLAAMRGTHLVHVGSGSASSTTSERARACCSTWCRRPSSGSRRWCAANSTATALTRRPAARRRIESTRTTGAAAT